MAGQHEEAALSQPLLAAQEGSAEKMVSAVSDCKLQEQCFLSVGATGDSESYKKVQRKLVIACILCFIFMVVEVVGGYIARSVAIMSDAAHMLSDVSAFLVSIFAAWAATQPSSWHYSFGYHRAEILGALVSVLTIWAVTGALVFEAVQRTINPVRVDGKLMFIISTAGVFFNILIALALGVHAHLGHSHGPEGCSGHGHSHGHGHTHDHDHKHDHSSHKHSHSHEHSHSHGGKSCNTSHNHSHSGTKQAAHAAGECHGHNHSNGDHNHNHDHNHSPGSSSSSHSHGSSSSSSVAEEGSSQPLLAGQQESAGAGAAAAGQAGAAAAGSAKECIVIDLPATAAAGATCGLAGHAVTCRCTISRTGSHEIEVRCELPTPAVVRSPGARPAAGSRPGTSAGGHHHDHDHHGHSHAHGGAASINLRSAVLHVIGDIVQSIGVAIAGALIWWKQDDPRWYIADPICTFVFSIVVLLTTKSVLRDILHVLMERTPTNMDIPAMSQVISDMEGVRDVHDLHIWNISTSTSPVLTAHVRVGPDARTLADANAILQKLERYLQGVGIQHSTIQICYTV